MSSQLKSIVEELKALYPKKHYNIIEFDSFQPDQILQVLSNVICTIESREIVDIKAEGREMTVKRLLGSLYLIKYRPPSGSEYDLAQSLFTGEKSAILPILEWLLKERLVLEKRAYLGRYLMKIEVPGALRGDSNFEEMYENYEQMLETFKEAHKEREQLLSAGGKTAELRGDLAVMERERDIVAAKVASLQKSRVEGSKANAALLARVQALREARSQRDMLLEQKSRLQATCSDLERFITRTKQQVTEARRAAHGVTPQGLLQRAEEEEKVSAYIANEKLPADIKGCQAQLQLLREVAAQTSLSRADLAQIEQQVRVLSTEVNGLLERRMAAVDPAEDKLNPFRQQAAMLGRKKEAAAEALGELKKESASLKNKLDALQGQLVPGGEAPLSEEQFKSYAAQQKPRNELFKARRSQLSAQTAECGVLSRTLEVLRAKQELAQRQLSSEEARLGLAGYSSAAAQLSEVNATKNQLDLQKESTLESLSKTILELNQIIATKKAHLAPAIQELRPMREQYQAALAEFTKAKQVYEATAANLSSAGNKIEQDIKGLEEEAREATSQAALLEAKTQVLGAQSELLQQELAFYKAGDKTNSLRERLNAKIADEERRGRHLKEAQRNLKENEPTNERQAVLWESLEKIFAAKMRYMETARRNSGIFRREKGAETLVITNN